MNDEQIDKLLSQSPPAVPDAIAEKIRAQIQRDTRPVRPLRSVAFYSVLFRALFVAITESYAAFLKMPGFLALTPRAAVEILLPLAVLAAVAANTAAKSMQPASGRLYSWPLSLLALVAYEAAAIHLFHDYSASSFVQSGLKCLALGMLGGVLVAGPFWFLFKQGFVVQTVKAGAALGLVSGLAGLIALTLHCDLFTVPHTTVWHAGIVVVCTLAGALFGGSLRPAR